jgi:hypothetical protein
LRRAIVGVLATGLMAGCSSGTARPPTSTAAPPASVLQAAEFPAAVRAVEAARGGPQRYVELNATPDGVNVFVAVDASDEVAYHYADGALDAPGPEQPRTSTPFTLDGVDVGLADDLVAETQARLPGATVVRAALLDLPEQGLRWAMRSRSPRGGLLDVVYTPDGDLVSVAPSA